MKYVVGNYKMNLTSRETIALVKGVLHGLKTDSVLLEIVLVPSFTALHDVQKLIKKTPLNLGAQNVAATGLGPHTGEVAAQQLVDVGCQYVIIGHSERRQAGENDNIVNAKIVQALAAGLTPIICVGESADARFAGQSGDVIAGQVTAALAEQKFPHHSPVIIAYEPIWAIGTTAATTQQIIEAHDLIRRVAVSTGLAPEFVKVLYGGSVNPENIAAIIREATVDGVLVGGASLKIHEFSAIVNAASEVMQAPAYVS